MLHCLVLNYFQIVLFDFALFNVEVFQCSTICCCTSCCYSKGPLATFFINTQQKYVAVCLQQNLSMAPYTRDFILNITTASLNQR